MINGFIILAVILIIAFIVYKTMKTRKSSETHISSSNCISITFFRDPGNDGNAKWTDCGGIIQTKHLEIGQKLVVCAQKNTWSGVTVTVGESCI